MFDAFEKLLTKQSKQSRLAEYEAARRAANQLIIDVDDWTAELVAKKLLVVEGYREKVGAIVVDGRLLTTPDGTSILVQATDANVAEMRRVGSWAFKLELDGDIWRVWEPPRKRGRAFDRDAFGDLMVRLIKGLD